MTLKCVVLATLGFTSAFVNADFIIVPPERSAEPAASYLDGGGYKDNISTENFTEIDRSKPDLEEEGQEPHASREFNSKVLAYGLPLNLTLPELMPRGLRLYIHDTVNLHKSVSFKTQSNENWRESLSRFLRANNLSVLINWDKSLAQVIPNTHNFASDGSENLITSSSGEQYVIRKLKSDYEMANQKGYMLIDGNVYPIKRSKEIQTGAPTFN